MEGGFSMLRIIRTTSIVLAGTAVAVLAFLYVFAGGYLLQRLLHKPGWPEMAATDFRLSHAMRMAWKDQPPAVHPGAYSWKTIAPGYDIAELPVLTDREEIDRIYLVRLDPARYAFSVHTDPRHPHWISGWEKALPDAALIVNGSFFAHKNVPDTPILTGGQPQGPGDYDARAGAFVASDSSTQVIDLRDGADWKTAFAGAHDAMVAYPLLIGADGQTHVNRKSRWLANRTFVAQDAQGRIVVGSTKEAFFSLDREADFLKIALPDLKVALNLDGGPVACQSVRAGGVHRLHIARWEAQEENGRVRLLNLPVAQSEMPIVLVATPRP
jgi:hypothetical protein